MISNTGYLMDFDLNISYEQEDFIICSCGYYKLLQLERLNTIRPAGRNDWQLLYIAEGKGHFILNGIEQIVEAGHIVLYHPNKPQNYFYLLEDHPEIYWIHFSGNKSRELLENIGFKEGFLYPVGKHKKFIGTMEAIIHELQLKSFGYQILCSAYANELFVNMSREYYQISTHSIWHDPQMEEIVESMYRNYQENIPIEKYADNYNMSVSWFIRKFKSCTGETPQQFLIKIRISQACQMLESTSLNIGEIAAFIGYDNPLYFSRLFKKVMGISPREYRHQ